MAKRILLRLIQGLTIVVATITCTIIAFVLLPVPPGKAALTAPMSSCSYGEIREGDRISTQLISLMKSTSDKMHVIREDAMYQLWNTPVGDFWYYGKPSRSDAFVLAEEGIDLYQTERIRPGAVVLDCGANYGTFTRRALARGASIVVAIEINPNIQEALRRTFAREIAEGRVVVYRKGVWDHDSSLDLRADSVVMEREGPIRRVEVTTIDHIASELQLRSVDFIKMDIEGSEKNALRGAREVLQRYSPILAISTEHLPDDAQRIPLLINELKPRTYTASYGFCLYDKPFHAAPNVIHFSK